MEESVFASCFSVLDPRSLREISRPAHKQGAEEKNTKLSLR